ncbi:amidohydrolase [Arthrobacter sp. MMS18-M83]|uniref:amidohydrolase n=1 Tax=Arthrobacter sp. MMS18-M83 TaxID=2996261 RepID=UPI00227B922D|nr:amidohydrolase [Arthrobacter sp. MMS18-M83]WAH97768.1 amidohydrolase [Arthrobacter sp. MMS18-M83]
MTHIGDIIRQVEELSPEFIAASDSIWDEPELRWEEYKSVDKLTALAQQHGLEITRGVGGIPTAFTAEAGTGGPVIAFLGEYDALAGLSQSSGSAVPEPDDANQTGNGQGCGHNLLGAGSLLAAVATANYLKENNLPGRVRFYGCPAEEAAAGKTYMVAGGAFEGIDAAISWHPGTATKFRQHSTLAYTQAYFHFKGLAAHAGVSPHLGRSALDAVELLNVGVNFLREHMPDAARIHYAITDSGGHSPNVVQANASVYYIVRAPEGEQMRDLYARVLRIAQGAALMTDTELTVEFDGACSEILHNDALELLQYDVVREVGPVPFDAEDQRRGAVIASSLEPREIQVQKEAVGMDPLSGKSLHDGLPAPSFTSPRRIVTASTDVGDVSWIAPTVQMYSATCAVGTPFHAWQTVAQGKLPAAHKGLIHAAKIMAGTALTLFLSPEALAQAQNEFTERTARTPYLCPIPEGTVAPPLRALANA